MQSFAVDSNNDLTLDKSGNLAIASDMHATLTVCEQVVKAIRGEMVYAKNQGMPNFQTVWTGAPKLAVWEHIFRARILKVPGVTGIESLEMQRDADILKYQAVINTIYGAGEIVGL